MCHTWSTAAMLSFRESIVVMKACTLPAMLTAECEPWEYLSNSSRSEYTNDAKG